MNETLKRQLVLDYCCKPDDVADNQNHFSPYRALPGQRSFFFPGVEHDYLKAAVVGGKLLMTGQPEILAWCRDAFADADGKWFMDGRCLARLQDRLRTDGRSLASVHPYFIAETESDPGKPPFSVRWYGSADIERFRGDGRFSSAYTFCAGAPDVIGVGAYDGDRVLGMAGASRDSDIMWQIGINVLPEARGRHIGAALVTLLKNEILRLGKLPFYGTALSHAASLRVAMEAGFLPAWAELYTKQTD